MGRRRAASCREAVGDRSDQTASELLGRRSDQKGDDVPLAAVGRHLVTAVDRPLAEVAAPSGLAEAVPLGVAEGRQDPDVGEHRRPCSAES